ncbi:MAG TPA: hypothetical protein VFT22_07385 [Kofleriaceae bacterium]|nr:hypothetical protein [Kofleriaceae bacterium]
MNDPTPLGRPARAHQIPSFFTHPARTTDPYYQPVPAVYPDQLRGRPARAHEFQFFAAPPKLATPTILQPLQPVVPFRLPGRPRRAHEFQAFASPDHFVTPVAPAIPAYGSAGAATFVLSLESGVKITYSWSTSVFTSYSGKEQRESPFGSPRRRIEGTAFLLDASDRDAKSALVRAAAQGSVFLLALPFEELLISSDSPNSTVNVESTALCDWAQPGQRAVIVAADDSLTYVVVQSTTSNSIAIVKTDASGNFAFGSLGTAGATGGRIMPLIQVTLDPTQGFARYPVTVDLWSVRAQVAVAGWAGVDSMGAGATLTSYFSADPLTVSQLTEDDLLIWDRSNAVDDTASESMLSRTELVDLGALAFAVGGAAAPDWGRSIKFRSNSLVDWQWLKAFARQVRGRQRPFLLSSGRTDMLYLSSASGTITIQSSAVSGAGDYTSWFGSEAHHRIAATLSDDSVQYATVLEVTDNGDGTLTLRIDSLITGTISKLSFAEMVRFESDELEVTWDGGAFAIDQGVVTVQDEVPDTKIFDTVIDASYTLPNNQVIIADLGTTTLINITPDRSLTFIGVSATGGNSDGMVVCIMGVVNGFGVFLDHENVSAPAQNRFWIANRSLKGGISVALWFRYSASVQRWIEIFGTA